MDLKSLVLFDRLERSCLHFWCASPLEIVGQPAGEVSPRHMILPNLELSALLVEWFTMWTGLMILASLEEGTELSPYFFGVEFLNIIVVAVNVDVVFIFNLVRECKHEHSDAYGGHKIVLFWTSVEKS